MLNSQNQKGILAGLGKNFLIWFLVLSLVPLTVVCTISYRSARDSLIYKTTQQLSTSLALKKEYIESFFSERVNDIEFQSTKVSNIDFLQKLEQLNRSFALKNQDNFDQSKWKFLEAEYRPDLEQFRKLYNYHDIFFLNIDGTILYSLTEVNDIGRNVFDTEPADSTLSLGCWQAIQSGETVISDMEKYRKNRASLDLFLIRNIPDRYGHQAGLIVLDISLNKINELLQDRTGLGNTGDTYLVGDDRVMRSDSWKQNGGKALETKILTDLMENWVRNHKQLGFGDHDDPELFSVGALSYVNQNGIEVYGGISELENLESFDIHWAIIAEIGKKEALALVDRLRLITIALFLVTVAVVFVASVVVARSIVLPIRRLSGWAEEMAEGKDVDMTGPMPENEIGLLRDSFTRMAQSFREITEVCQAIAEGDFSKSVKVRSDDDNLGKAVNQMVDNLQAVVRQAEVITEGDFSAKISPWSIDDQLGTTLLRMTRQLQEMEASNRQALEQARRLTDHLENLPTPVLTINKNYRIQYINTAGAAMAGLTKDECLGRYCYELFSNEHCQSRDCRVGQAMISKRVEMAETVIYPGNKKSMPIRYTGAPILDEQGDVTGALEYIIDITEAKTALQAIERENWIQEGVSLINDRLRGELELDGLCNNLLSCLAQRLQLPMAAMYVAEEDSFKLYAKYATDGKIDSRQEFRVGEGLVGQAAREKRTIFVDNIPPESIRLVSGTLEAAPREIIALPLSYEEKVMGVIELGAFEPLNDKERVFLDRVAGHIAITINTTRSRLQLAQLLAKTQQQAMELQQQQEELRVTNEELEAQTMSLKDREAQLQTQHEELRVVNEELEEKTRSLEQQRADIQAKNRDLEKTRRDLEQKAEELATASKYKSEFLANMSHELRTPLNSLLLLSHNLAQNKEGNLSEDQVESAEIMYNSGNDLLDLINDILDLAKIEAGHVDLKPGDLQLDEFAVHMQNYFQAFSEDKTLDFTVTVDPQAPSSIYTDRQRLEQILRNLISNAIKFTDTGGISITFRPISLEDTAKVPNLEPDTTLAISVADTGIGIPEDKQKVIFEAFHQADGSTSRKYGGTGLGLSISRDMAALLGGEIVLDSTENQGSTFTLYLPFILTADTDNSRDTAQPAALRPSSRTKKQAAPHRQPAPGTELADDRDIIGEGDKTILIVEDDINFARTLVKQSHQKGFKCLASSSGHTGLMLAEEFRPDAVILDLNLPDMTGWEVLDALKKNPTLRHIPVHMISAEEKTLDAFKKGAVGFLHKPVSQEDLHNAFNRLESVISSDIRDLLIIEDDDNLRQQIAQLLDDGNIRIEGVGTGTEAIDVIRKKKFDCMILDIGLPDMSGFEFLGLLDKESDSELPPVIVYTGRELTREEHEKLYRYTDSIIIKGVKSVERLLDETALFLHRVVDHMPADYRKMIANLYEQDSMFAGKKILIVDDDMRNAFALSKILSEKKMEVLIANNGRKALDALDENDDIELILMDIMMPGMDGYETIRTIRKQEKFWNLPILALTAKAMPDDKAKCLQAGANDYLSKPIEEARLLSMMRIWLYR